MGQAKARGTFEERKAQAIAEGRVKVPAVKREARRDYGNPESTWLTAMALYYAAMGRRKWRF